MTTHAAARYLAQAHGATVLQAGADRTVTAAAPDREAGPGALAWVSPAGLASDPGRVAAFAGALLVVPLGTDVAGVDAACTVVAAAVPKLVFGVAVVLCLPELLGERWPALGEPPVHPDAVVDPTATLACGVVIGAGVVVEAGASVGPNTVLAHTTVEAGATVGANCSVGLDGFGFERDAAGALVRFPHVGRVRIAAGASVGSNTCIDRAALGETVVGRGAKVDNLVHVAHNVRIGEDSLVIAHAMLGGSVRVGARAWIAPSAAVINQATVGDDAVVGLGAVVIRSVAAGETVAGNPARPIARPT